ncbi:MAG: lipocalin-like domain-containing protein, partial [Ginsengibacter sp.]
MKLKFYFFITIVFFHNICYSQDWKIFPYTPQGSLISFPKDEGRHASEPVEWWYTTGHFTIAGSGKRYSYMLTYFSFPVASFDGFRILNITDEETGKFYQDSRPVNYSTLSNHHLEIQANVYQGESESWTNKKDVNNKLIPYQYTIHAASPDLQLNLNYISLKRPLILGGTGYLEQGVSDFTWYYAQTHIDVSGQFTLNGVTGDVNGTAWIDRQYGNFNPWTGEKYEWFHAQLSNGMDMNFWNIFTADNKISNNKKYCLLSAYVNDTTQYTISDFKIERLGYSWMPDSAMCYADKWRLTSEKNNMDLTITTKHH